MEAPSGGDFKAFKKAYETHLQGIQSFEYILLGAYGIDLGGFSFHHNSYLSVFAYVS